VAKVADITELKEAQDKLQSTLKQVKDSEQLLNTIINATPDWIFVKDKEFRWILANEGVAGAIGTTPENLLSKTDLEIGFPEELVFGNPEKGIVGFRSDDKAVLAGERIHNSYDPATIADGSVRIFDTYKLPLRNENGDVFGVVGMARDITDLKRVEDELREREELLSSVLAHIPFIVFWKDRQSTYLGCNDYFAKVIGLESPEQIVGKVDEDMP
jgi:PAS domain S-box-containing protein